MNSDTSPFAEILVTAATLVGMVFGPVVLLVIVCIAFAKCCHWIKERYWATAVLTLVGGLAVAGGPAFSGESAEPGGLTFLGEPVTEDRIARGQEIYAETCASCHGANLEGASDWRRRLDNGRMPAPPHDETGHTWHHSDRDLFTMTKLGVSAVVPGYESDMPAYQGVLSDAEIIAVLAFIKSTWPERQRAAQARITKNDGSGS